MNLHSVEALQVSYALLASLLAISKSEGFKNRQKSPDFYDSHANY